QELRAAMINVLLHDGLPCIISRFCITIKGLIPIREAISRATNVFGTLFWYALGMMSDFVSAIAIRCAFSKFCRLANVANPETSFFANLLLLISDFVLG